MTELDRKKLRLFPLPQRKNLLDINKLAIQPGDALPEIGEREAAQVVAVAKRAAIARADGRPVILTFGAHLIKNGLAPVVISMLEHGWITHVATNGAGSIHDWEFAYQGLTAEDVRENVAQGAFGLWHETGLYLNLSLAIGAADGIGYGASVGRMIAEQELRIPAARDALQHSADLCGSGEYDKAAALCDLLEVLSECEVQAGRIALPHPFRESSVQRAAYELGVPFTVHPGIGYDIIHTHPAACGGAIGRAAYRDFLAYAHSVSRLDGGVHIAVGSSVMAPMVFEKSLSMANNLAIQERGAPITGHYVAVVDIQSGGDWDWSRGEPPKDNPAYYLRFCKTFYRMGGTLDYICLDNRTFVQHLHRCLEKESAA